MQRRPINALRFEPEAHGGHVESFFQRANHPSRPLAFWQKVTVLKSHGQPAIAELWFIFFDGERHRTWAEKVTVPFAEARFEGTPPCIEIAGARVRLGPEGEARGRLQSAQEGALVFDLRAHADAGPLGQALNLMPLEAMLEAPFPKFKVVTPHPLLRFEGRVEVWGEVFKLDDWAGMQGHNWGNEHTWRYTWGQCHFLDEGGAPFCTVEGFSSRLRLAGWVTPLISGLIVRRGGRSYRFDRLVDLWRQRPKIGQTSWILEVRGAPGRARLEMRADPRDMVCLGYHNPGGRISYCFNSKLAWARLRVNPVNERGFECVSPHGGALELLRNQADPRFRVV